MEIVATERQIRDSVSRLAKEIRSSYAEPPLLVGVLKGSFIFLADLVRELGLDVEIDFICVRSYLGSRTTPAVELRFDVAVETVGRDVLIVEDIVDSGLTLDWVVGHLLAKRVGSVKVAALFFKPTSFRGRNRPDFVGIEIPEQFVIGYGMDLDEKGRGMPYVKRTPEA